MVLCKCSWAGHRYIKPYKYLSLRLLDLMYKKNIMFSDLPTCRCWKYNFSFYRQKYYCLKNTRTELSKYLLHIWVILSKPCTSYQVPHVWRNCLPTSHTENLLHMPHHGLVCHRWVVPCRGGLDNILTGVRKEGFHVFLSVISFILIYHLYLSFIISFSLPHWPFLHAECSPLHLHNDN